MKAFAVILVLCGFSCVFSLPVETSKSNSNSHEPQRRSAIGSIGNYTGSMSGEPGHGSIGNVDNYIIGSSSGSPPGSSYSNPISGSAPGLVNYYSSNDHGNPAATFVPKYLYAGWKLIPNGFSAMEDFDTGSYWRSKAQYWNSQNSKTGASPEIVNYYD